MKYSEFEKSKIFSIVGISEYVPHGVVKTNLIKKSTGTVKTIAIDKGENLTEELSRFDHFIQIIEGKAEVLIDGKSYNLNSGESIIIPANSKNTIKANEKFKMISTIIKSGYE